jgi:hypothetical protein
MAALITVDNVSNNDNMFMHLDKLLVGYPGPINQTQCFAHTINLCAKSILKHFDLPKKDDKDTLESAANVLVDLAKNIDHKADRG